RVVDSQCRYGGKEEKVADDERPPFGQSVPAKTPSSPGVGGAEGAGEEGRGDEGLGWGRSGAKLAPTAPRRPSAALLALLLGGSLLGLGGLAALDVNGGGGHAVLDGDRGADLEVAGDLGVVARDLPTLAPLLHHDHVAGELEHRSRHLVGLRRRRQDGE